MKKIENMLGKRLFSLNFYTKNDAVFGYFANYFKV